MNIQKIAVYGSFAASMLISSVSFAETLEVESVTATQGSISSQPLSVLNNLEQNGSEDEWDTYIELTPGSSKFAGTFSFNQPNTEQWQSLTLNVNSLGSVKTEQQWRVQLRDFVNSKWVTVGDNSAATGWVWLNQSISITSNVNNYVASTGDIEVRYISNNSYDISNIDLMTIDMIKEEVTEPGDGGGTTPEPKDWWQPSPNDSITWQWQINGTLNTSLNVDMFDIDLFDTSAEQIASLQNNDKIVICYFSAGTYEGWRSDWQEFFPDIVTGDSYTGNAAPFAGNMAEWDERWLDIRRTDLLEGIMRSRMELAASKGCDGVEPDNMDAYTNGSETGINLTAQDQVNFNRWIAELAHEYGLSVGLKNDVDQLDELVDYFDWALNEQCFQYNECEGYSAFVNAGKAVFGVEYTVEASSFCPEANEQGLFWLKKNLDLGVERVGCEGWSGY